MRALVFAIPVALLVIAVGCQEDWKRCYAGDYVSCSCTGGAFGYAQCNNVDAFGPCVCAGTTPGLDASAGSSSGLIGADAASEAAAPVVACKPGTGTKPYFDDCAANEECASCLCESVGTSTVCTTACKTVADCAPPADSCITRGFCHPPE